MKADTVDNGGNTVPIGGPGERAVDQGAGFGDDDPLIARIGGFGDDDGFKTSALLIGASHERELLAVGREGDSAIDIFEHEFRDLEQTG